MANVAVVGGTEDTRLLLRGLLRLHRHRVIGECGQVDFPRILPADGAPLVLLMDVDLDDAAWAEAIRETLRQRPHVRGILISPRQTKRLEEQARSLGIETLLLRPFAVRELLDAMDRAAPGTAPPPAGPS